MKKKEKKKELDVKDGMLKGLDKLISAINIIEFLCSIVIVVCIGAIIFLVVPRVIYNKEIKLNDFKDALESTVNDEIYDATNVETYKQDITHNLVCYDDINTNEHKCVVQNNYLYVCEFFVLSGITTLFLEILKKVLYSIKIKETPFTEESCKGFRIISIILLILSLLEDSLIAIICSCILMFITYVFKYGYKLQKESDETL